MKPEVASTCQVCGTRIPADLGFYPVCALPERRALGDAAVNEALRLRPDLSEVHAAIAFHLYYCYRDFKRARVQIAIAAQALPNNPDVLELTALPKS